MKFEPRTEENNPGALFQLMKKHLPKKRMSIGMNVGGGEENISCIKVPRIVKPELILMRFLNSKKYSFIENKEFTPKTKKVNLQLTPHQVYPVTDRKNNILNSVENFSKTNEIIKHYFSRYGTPVINQIKADDTLKEIEKSIKDSKDDNFLLTF